MRITQLPLPAFLCALLLAASTSRGQVMADRVPADAVAYAGWSGTDAVAPAYNGSHLKSLLATLNLPQYLSQAIQDGAAEIKDPEKSRALGVLQEALGAMSRSPTACYFQTMDTSNPQQPVPHMAIFSKVGAAVAEPLAARFEELIKASPPPAGLPVGAVAVGEYLLLYMGDNAMEERLKGPVPVDNLAASETFKHSFAQVASAGASPAIAVYVDAAEGVRLVQNAVLMSAGARVRQMVPTVIDALGLNGLQQVAWAGNFDGANWQSSAFVGMSARRSGILSFFDTKPLSPDALKVVPSTASFATLVQFDGERLLTEISDAASHVSERAPQQVEMGFQQVFAFTGVDVKKELLPSLGNEFIVYGAPTAAGDSVRGLTLVNRLKDAKKAESALTAAENFVNLLILQRDPNSKAQFHTEALPAPLDKVTAHIMALERVQPAWAISDGVLYFSLSLPGLQGAIDAATAGIAGSKPTLLDNAAFAGLRKRLGEQPISTFLFADLAASAPDSYEIISNALNQQRAAHPDAPHPYVLPPLDRIKGDLGPMLRVAWSDAEGFHVRETGPFPGASALTPLQMMFMRVAELGQMQRRAMPAPGTPGLP
jgi:hypothetical protein